MGNYGFSYTVFALFNFFYFPIFFFPVMITSSYKITCVFPFLLMCLIKMITNIQKKHDHKYSKAQMQHQQNEHVLQAKLKEEC